MHDLGTLGGSWSYPFAINASGWVVGHSETPHGTRHAFLYDGTMHDLNNLLNASGAGWTLEYATDINDTGQIAANGTRPDGTSSALLLTPRITVPLDVKPGSSINRINPRSRGKIPVAILSAPTFVAPTEVDQASLTFGRTGDEPSLVSCKSKPKDLNGDGLLDLVCHFATRTAAFRAHDRMAHLKGKTVSGMALTGFDSVSISSWEE
jgi:probable HAF family extracellular repeat protein